MCLFQSNFSGCRIDTLITREPHEVVLTLFVHFQRCFPRRNIVPQTTGKFYTFMFALLMFYRMRCSCRNIITLIARISDSVVFVLCMEGDTGLIPADKVEKIPGIRYSFVNISLVSLQLKGALEVELTQITGVDNILKLCFVCKE